MTKIDIISGFLGAGKTTFIKKLLQEAIKGEQVVLIENEFGQIGIDGGFLKDSGIEIREMNSGCICCSLVGDFGKSLEEVLTKYKPERVIIEPSGVGKLSDVMNAVRDVAKNLDVKLNSAVTIVDATKCKMYMKNFGEFFNNQIENAGTIVMSRTDVADSKKVLADVDLLREHNKDASIVTTPIDQLTGAQLLELIEKPDTMMEELLAQVKEEHAHHHHHDHDGHCSCGCEDHDHEDHDHEDHEHHHHDHDGECGCEDHDHEHHHHDHDHGHHHHTGMGEIRHLLGHLELPEAVRADAEAVYGLIAEAESHAHGAPVEEIHFHEVGSLDAVADVAGVCLLVHMLGVERIVASPVHVGSGQVRCAHGILPVPAPATAGDRSAPARRAHVRRTRER